MLKEDFYDRCECNSYWSLQVLLRLSASVGLAAERYKLATEYRLLTQYLNAGKATLLYIDGELVAPNTTPPRRLGVGHSLLYRL